MDVGDASDGEGAVVALEAHLDGLQLGVGLHLSLVTPALVAESGLTSDHRCSPLVVTWVVPGVVHGHWGASMLMG